MTSLVGNEAARATFLAAMRGPAMHHAWLFAGPEGVGKGTFARAAAARLLAEAAAPGTLGAALDLPADNPTRALIAAGRSEEHPSELPSIMRISFAVFCLQKKTRN